MSCWFGLGNFLRNFVGIEYVSFVGREFFIGERTMSSSNVKSIESNMYKIEKEEKKPNKLWLNMLW